MSAAAAPKRAFWFYEAKTPNVADYMEQEQPDIEMHRLRFETPAAKNWEIMATCHAYCITSTRDEVPDEFKCHEALLARLPDLLVVSTTGAGYDTVDLQACTRAGVLAVNQSGSNAQAVAEHALGMLLALTKNMPWTDRSLRRERGLPRETFKGWNANRKTVGIIGLGEVGRRLARICRHGLDMEVLAYDPYLDAATCEARDARKVDLDTLLAESRYVSVNCPLTAETRNMIGARELAKMQAGSFLVNTARGGIVDEMALARALRSHHLAGAGVDVWQVEPPSLEHPLLAIDNLIATYHTAGVTVDSRLAMAQWNAEQVADSLRGKRPPRLLNPEAWEAYKPRFKRIFGFEPG
jgi:D-3-phosphoglycerate dehydrogenase